MRDHFCRKTLSILACTLRFLLSGALITLTSPSVSADGFFDRVTAARIAAGVDPQLGLAELSELRNELTGTSILEQRLTLDETECRIQSELDVSKALAIATAGLAAAGPNPAPPAREPWLRLRVCNANMELETGKHEEGYRELENLLAITKSPEDASAHALALTIRGIHSSREGNLDAAQKDLLSACEQLKLYGPDYDYELCLNHLSNHYRRIGDTSESLSLLHELNDRAKQRGATFDISIYSFNIGQALQSLQHWDDSIHNLEQARDASLQLNDTLGVIYADHAIANAMLNTDHPEEALTLTTRTLAQLDPATDPRKYELVSESHADALTKLGHTTEALEVLDNIEEALRARGSQYYLQYWLTIRASALSQQEHWQDAYEALSEAQTIGKEIEEQKLSEQSAKLRMQFNRAHDAENLQSLRQLNEQGQRLRQTQAIALVLFITLLMIALTVAVRKFRQAHHLQSQASTDELTGLPNRRAVMTFASDSIDRAHQESSPLAILMMDIDHFKRINDTYGHPVGDDVLRHIAGILREGRREHDRIGRLGGEEFLAVLYGASLSHAEQVAKRIHRAIKESVVTTREGEVRYTVSIGIASLRSDEKVDAIVSRADTALYRAKNGGRDRVEVEDQHG